MKKFLAFISIVLVLAVGAGGIYLFAVNPNARVLKAAQKTVFDSSEFNITVKKVYKNNNFDETKINLVIGDDINSTTLEMRQTSSIGNVESVSTIKDGKIYDNENEASVEDALDEFEDSLKDYLPEDTDLAEEIDNVLNGKIDEKAFKKSYNKVAAPALEKIIEEEYGETVKLPDYDKAFDILTALFKEDAVKEAIVIKTSNFNFSGTTYEYTIDTAKLAEAILDYAEKNDKYKEVLEIIANKLGTSAEEINSFTGTLTIKSGRIINLTANIEKDTETVIFTVDTVK